MKRGFTLIELLVVITILAVLAGAATPYVQSYVEEARIAKAKTDLEEIARALMVYETREGAYNFEDVSVLTGRYLNKAPIDPWGKAYGVSTASGYVYSGGPDRTMTTGDDNLTFAYQPPLALVSVKWVDKNNSGMVDSQNVNDELHLLFNRSLSATNTEGFYGADTCSSTLDKCFGISAPAALGSISSVVDTYATSVTIVASRTIVLKVKTGQKEGFQIGSDKIWVINDHETLQDLASPPNYSISSQPVTILPQ